jgi:hypothetical protein
MTIHDDVDTLKANEQHRLNVLRRFKRALLASEVSALPDLCASIDGECIWPEAWERVMTIKHLSDDVKEFFVRLWFDWGSHLRQEAGDDLLFIPALRKIMPSYTGGDMILYRGESAGNRDKCTYGVCWSAQISIARQHAESGLFHRYSRGGSRLLRARVPASNIITHIGARDGHIEEEYLVDRRGLPENAVRVLEVFSELDPNAAPIGDQLERPPHGR